MDKVQVLLIEDDLTLGGIVKEALGKRGFDVHVCRGQTFAMEHALLHKPDVYIVDVMLMDGDGFSFVKELRRSQPEAPVIFLTALTATSEVVKGFELGANDYMRKPFSIEELIVRVENLLRKKNRSSSLTPEENIVPLGKYTFDMTKQTLTISDSVQKLSHRQNEILKLLYINRNQVLERKSVLIQHWGDDNFFNARSMDVFIARLRGFLKQDPSVEIVNIRGVGYKLLVG